MALADALLCPAISLAFNALWAGARWLRYRALRYHLSPKRGFIERPGLYVIAFDFDGPPVSIPSRLARGDLGTIRFLKPRGRLLARTGLLAGVPETKCEFLRVDDPDALVDVWESST